MATQLLTVGKLSTPLESLTHSKQSSNAVLRPSQVCCQWLPSCVVVAQLVVSMCSVCGGV